MNHSRLALVTPRYWPQAGEAERYLSNLAGELLRQGARLHVVTAKWSADWPAEVLHRDIPVTRLPTAPRGGWSTLRYLRELSRWLRHHGGEFDVAYITNLRHEAYASLGALRQRKTAVVCRLHSGGPLGDCNWQETARFGRRIRRRCFDADAILAANNTLTHELLDAGYPAERIHQVPYGAASISARSSPQRFQARRALAQINHDLGTADYAPVAVCLHRLEKQHALLDLISAWRTIAARWPSAKLWLIGDGPFRPALYERIVDFGLHRQIIMPGSFDELEEVFLAADVVVAPSPWAGGSPSLVAALAAGMPVVAVSTTDNLDMMDHGVHGLLVPARDHGALSNAISKLFETPDLATRLGDAARQCAQQAYALDRVATRHLELFSRLVATRQRGST